MSYTLQYTGAEIDSILGRSAPGGQLDTDIAAKAPLASPALTGDPTAPTQSEGDNSTKLATTAYADRAAADASYAAYPTDSVSGDVVSFPDGADGIPVKSFVGSIIPAQSGSGDPAPDNVRPISGWTGANIYRIKMEQGSYSAESGNIDVSTRIRSNGWIKQTGGAITVTLSPSNYEWIVFNADSADGANAASIGGWSNSGATGTVLKQYIKIIVRNKTNPSADITPSEVVAKIDGIDPTIAIAFGQTVYAGTLTALGGGKWQIQPTHAVVDMGSLSWTYYSASNAFYCTIADMNRANNDFVCSAYALNPHPVAEISDGQFTNKSGANNTLWFKNSAYTDATAFDSSVTGQTLCYRLATLPDPITITGEDLQTLLGANTVWLDCGSVTGMTYRADTALYIQKLLNGGGTLSTLSMASPSPSFSLGRVGVLAEPEEAEQLEQTEEPEQTEEA